MVQLWSTCAYMHVACRVVPTLSAEQRPAQCTLRRGDVLYIPGGRYHATLNINFTVWMTSFISLKGVAH